LGSLKAFLLAFALLFGPVAEAFACGLEMPVAATEQQAAVASPDQSGSHGNTQDGICEHGHCHHGGWVITPQLTEISVQAAASERSAPPACGLLMSRSTSRLERPPRA